MRPVEPRRLQMRCEKAQDPFPLVSDVSGLAGLMALPRVGDELGGHHAEGPLVTAVVAERRVVDETDQVGARATHQHCGSGHGQRAEPVDETLLQVFREADAGAVRLFAAKDHAPATEARTVGQLGHGPTLQRWLRPSCHVFEGRIRGRLLERAERQFDAPPNIPRLDVD